VVHLSKQSRNISIRLCMWVRFFFPNFFIYRLFLYYIYLVIASILHYPGGFVEKDGQASEFVRVRVPGFLL